MPHIENNQPGVVSWIELATSDPEAAKKFYASLFNWAFTDSPIGQDEFYTMFDLAGRKVAAAYTMRSDEAEMGVPPHWNVYFAVTSADETAGRVNELGGELLVPPFDVMSHGRMAVIRDPQGAIFCIWQAKDHTGVGVKSEPGSLCWVDLNTPDQPAATGFYSQLFGWSFEPGDGGYLHIKAGDEFIGGVPSAEQVPPGTPPHWLIYLQTDACDALTARAAELGAKVCLAPITLEKVGRFSVVTDPQGAAFSLFQPAPRG